MGCPCRANRQKEAQTSVNQDPMAAQRAYDANHAQQTQTNEQITASARN
jgi:hypothetical protein